MENKKIYLIAETQLNFYGNAFGANYFNKACL